MKAELVLGGRLNLIAENDTEGYALSMWMKQAHRDIEYAGVPEVAVRIGNLTLGPQPVRLETVKKDDD